MSKMACGGHAGGHKCQRRVRRAFRMALSEAVQDGAFATPSPSRGSPKDARTTGSIPVSRFVGIRALEQQFAERRIFPWCWSGKLQRLRPRVIVRRTLIAVVAVAALLVV